MPIFIKYNLDEKNSIIFDSFNQIIDYDKVVYIDCLWNGLTLLPELPKSLKKFGCYSNQLTSLPELPKSLQYLHCIENKLTSLPELP
jgi:Leucine-rich repeat (LRR) protein